MKKVLKKLGVAFLSVLFVVCAAFMLMPAKTQVAEAALYPYYEATTLSDLLGDNHSRTLESNSVVTISNCTTSGQTLIIKYNGASDYSSDMSRLQWSYTVTGSVSMSAAAASVRITSNKPMENLRFGGSSNSVYLTLESSTASSYTYSGTVINKSSYFGLTFGQFNGQIQDVALTALEFQIYTGSVPQSCTVTLNKNNGTGGTDSVTASYGSAMPSATMPTRTGATFKGYYAASSGGTQYYTSAGASARNWDKSDETATLYAQWTANKYSITYKDGGNKTFSGTHASGYPTQHTYGTATNLKSATKTGYTFGGWFTNSNCTGTAVTSLGATAYTANITLYAKWTSNKYTVTLDDNGGSGGPGSVEIYFDSNFAPIIEAQLPTKEGYTFAGYYDEQNVGDVVASPSGTLYILGTGASNKAWNKPNDAILYAYYTKDMTVSATGYEADYDGNSHTITVTVTDPASDYFILYRDPETSSNTNVNPAKTNVGSYTIDFYVSKDGYTQYKGSATIVIKEVDKTALAESIATDDSYYDLIKDDYSSIASNLKDIIDNIKNNIRDNANVTAAQVAQAVVDLQTALSTAKVDVTKAMIDAIGSGDYSAEKAEKIHKAREYYDNELTEDEQAAVTNYAALQSAEALYGPVGEVVDQITNLKLIEDPQQFKAAVQDARANYEALSEDKKEVFPDDALTLLADSQAIIPVVEKINAIGASEDTAAFREAVADARADYDAFTDNQKAIFPASVLNVLNNDQAAIDVMDIINAIGKVEYTEDSKAKIDAANEAYAELTDEQKPLVANYGKLEKANADYDAVDDAVNAVNAIGTVYFDQTVKNLIDAARGKVDAFTSDQASIFPDESLTTLIDAEKVYDAMQKIRAIPTPIENTEDYVAKVRNAQSAVDNLNADQLEDLGETYIDALNDYVKVADVIDALNAIEKVEYTPEVGKAIDNVNALIEQLTDKQLQLLPDGLLGDLADIEAAYDVLGLIDAIGKVEYTDGSKAKIDAANEAYAHLTDAQKALVDNDKLVKANADYDAVDQAVKKVDAIGDVEYTPECKALIDEAREFYNSLSAYQKSIFPNEQLKTLVDAEKAYRAMDKINDIGSLENTSECKDKIGFARNIFDSLTADQKALVDQDKIDELVNAEKAYRAIEMINAIGKVEYTEDSKEKIEAARDAYRALSPEQKTLVPAIDLGSLEEAEKSYETIEKNAGTLSLVMNIVFGVLLAVGIIVLIILLRKKNAQKSSDTKVMSFAALPMLLAANHYFDAPFIILYVIAFLTLAVWCLNLIIYLQMRKAKAHADEEQLPAEEDDQTANEAATVASVAEDDEEDEEESVTVTDDSGNRFRIRYVKSFTAKLIQSDDTAKEYYAQLKNLALSYGKAVSRVSWKYESINVGRKPLLKFGFRGKTLCVYFPLDTAEFKATKYKVELIESKAFATVPCLYRIKNGYRCELCKDLIAMVAERLDLAMGEKIDAVYHLPYEDNEALLEKGLIKELKTQLDAPVSTFGIAEREATRTITVWEADQSMPDEVAATLVQLDLDGKAHKGKKGIINIDTIGENFNDGDTVDIEALWEKKLIPHSVGHVKVLARGTLSKKLNVDLQEYSIQAVKMILLEGGTVKKAR
ncbi:MAG: uL15 family ribosomal protein [Clostridia bacterium]|nr:uL15 family ribosomal protein [Clostridia bacterium]